MAEGLDSSPPYSFLRYDAGMSDKPATPPPPSLQLQLDEQVAQGSYSNLVIINHSENEFVLDFAYVQPQSTQAKVRSRVISSPRHTKRLLLALQANVARYEERFGEIKISGDAPPDPSLVH